MILYAYWRFWSERKYFDSNRSQLFGSRILYRHFIRYNLEQAPNIKVRLCQPDLYLQLLFGLDQLRYKIILFKLYQLVKCLLLFFVNCIDAGAHNPVCIHRRKPSIENGGIITIH